MNFSFLALKFANFETLPTLYFYVDEFKNGKANITTVMTQMNYNSLRYFYDILDGTRDCLTVIPGYA